jgi:NADH:ubiquinone reductase (non-electrogenic)
MWTSVSPWGEGGKLNDLIDKFDGNKNGTLCLKEFTRALAEADARLSSHPATAQVRI